MVSEALTTDVSTGAAGGAVVEAELPDAIVPDCGAETGDVSDDEICVSVDVLVVPGSSVTAARKRGAVGSALVESVLVGSAGAAFPSAGAAGVDVSARGAAGVAGAVGAGAGVAGSCTGAPTDSETVGVDWNRSTGVFVRAIPELPISEYESVTTETLLRTAAGDVACGAPAAFVVRNGGSGATWCNVGTRSNGSDALGNVRVASGVVGPANDCWRSATAAIGPTYRKASTEMPMPAHQ